MVLSEVAIKRYLRWVFLHKSISNCGLGIPWPPNPITMDIEVYQYGEKQEWGWRLIASNGNIVAHGTGLNTKQALKKSLLVVKSAFSDITNVNINNVVDEA